MKIKSYAPGGVVEGPSHQQGGVPAVDPTGQQIAEIEGDERIFSVDDTQEIEQMALAIKELPGDEANQAAMELGYKIVGMVAEQDRAQAEQDIAIQNEQASSPIPAQGQPVENMEQVDPALAGLI